MQAHKTEESLHYADFIVCFTAALTPCLMWFGLKRALMKLIPGVTVEIKSIGVCMCSDLLSAVPHLNGLISPHFGWNSPGGIACKHYLKTELCPPRRSGAASRCALQSFPSPARAWDESPCMNNVLPSDSIALNNSPSTLSQHDLSRQEWWADLRAKLNGFFWTKLRT